MPHRRNYAESTSTRRLTEGVISRRLVAYLVDAVVIFCLVSIFYVVIAVLGVVTFGLAWLAYAIPIPAIGILYSALTISSSRQATIGMRMAGVKVVEERTGLTVPAITAAAHALFFYVALLSFVLFVINVIIGIARADSRMGHDLLAGITAIRG